MVKISTRKSNSIKYTLDNLSLCLLSSSQEKFTKKYFIMVLHESTRNQKEMIPLNDKRDFGKLCYFDVVVAWDEEILSARNQNETISLKTTWKILEDNVMFFDVGSSCSWVVAWGNLQKISLCSMRNQQHNWCLVASWNFGRDNIIFDLCFFMSWETLQLVFWRF